MSLNDFFDDGKAKTRSLFIFSTGQIRLVKSFPYLIQAFSWNSDAIILYRDENFFASFGRFNGNRRIQFTEFDCIVQQIIENLLDFSSISIDMQTFGCKYKLDGDFLCFTSALKRRCCIADRFMNIELGLVEEKMFGIELIECQQVFGQIGQTFRFG